MHKYKQFKTFTLMFLGILFLLPIGVFAMGPQTQWLNNNEVVATQNSQTLSVPSFIHSTAIKMRIYGVTSLTASNDYSFRVNFSLRTQGSNPYITQCGLNINNSYVATSSLTFSRTSREIGSSFTDSSFVVTANYTMLSSYGEVPIFIQCDLNDLFLQSNYSATATSGQGSIINSIDQNGQNIISNNNYNTDKENANRDSNTTRNIENRTSLFNGLQQTLSNILQTLQDKLNDVKTGISNAINTGVNLLISAMDGLQMGINGVISKLSEISSNITNAISNGINSVVNKIGEMIGTQEVCTTYYQTNSNKVIYGDSATIDKRLDPEGNEMNYTNLSITAYIPIEPNSTFKFRENINYSGTTTMCFYRPDKTIYSCNSYSLNEEHTITTNRFISYVRYNFLTSNVSTSYLKGDCHNNGLFGIFNSFTQFVRDFFTINTDGANTGFQGFIDDFTNSEDYGGLQRVITSPLNMVDNFNSTCTPINLTFPHTNNSIQLPCIQTYLSGFISADFVNLIKLVVNGFICYRCVSQLLLFFHDLKDPHNDEIEVLDL